MKTVDNVLFSIPVDLARDVISKWLTMEDVGRLDSAYCSTTFRSTLLNGIEIITPKQFEQDELIYGWLQWAVTHRIQLFYRLEHMPLPTEPTNDVVVKVVDKVELLLYTHDVALMSIACWAVLYVSTTLKFAQIAQPRYYRKIRELLTHPHRSLQALAIRNVSNLSAEGEAESAPIIEYNILPVLSNLLYDPQMRTRKSACWIIANILAETAERVKHVFDAGIMPRLVELIQKDHPLVCKEITWALSNCTRGATAEQLVYLIDLGFVPQLCRMLLTSTEQDVVDVALLGLTNVLVRNVVPAACMAEMMLSTGAVAKILDMTRSREVSAALMHILWIFMKTVSEVILSVPVDLTKNVLSTWLRMVDVGRLDAAYCSRSFRSSYLTGLEITTPTSFPHEQFIFVWLEWAVSNRIQLFYRLEHPTLATEPEDDFVVRVVDTVKLLLYSHDVALMSIACWAVVYVGTTQKFGQVAQPRYYRKIRDLLTHPHRSLQALAIRNVANMSSEGEAESAPIITYKMLPIIKSLLYDPHMRTRKSACWIIANILAESAVRKQTVFDAGILPRLAELVQTDDDLVRKEITWALTNCIKGATLEQVECLLELDVLPQLCRVFLTAVASVSLVAFNGIEQLLRRNIPGMAATVMNCGAVPKIKEMTRSCNSAIAADASYIMDACYPQFVAATVV